jgi:DNA-binding NtrC family response regulator
VTEALRRIATESFDVLITDYLHMPDPGEGFTVVSAMRHSQPNALTMGSAATPTCKAPWPPSLLEADEIVVKPFEIGRLTELVNQKILNRKPTKRLDKERGRDTPAVCQQHRRKLVWSGRNRAVT